MADATLLVNGILVNENTIGPQEILIQNKRIAQIAPQIHAPGAQVYDLEGAYLLPGGIDSHVHFRTPGFTHKGSLYSESRAAVAGGVTAFMDMPNTNPPTTTLERLEQKYALASTQSICNYGFYLGATTDNIDTIKRATTQQTCGIKLFMGSSTGDLLVDDPEVLDQIFGATPLLLLTHCEEESIIEGLKNSILHPVAADHPQLRPRAGCLQSTRKAIALAQKHQAQLHVLHLTTAEEVTLFGADAHISAEACPQHLVFSNADYARLGNYLKVNPAVKTPEDQAALWQGIQNGNITTIGSDHAPHTHPEKKAPYAQSPSGMPMVQHTAYVLFQAHLMGKLSLADIVRLRSHAPATRLGIVDRGFVREGYYADLCVFKKVNPHTVPIHYACGWSPLADTPFAVQCTHTWVNGQLVWQKGKCRAGITGMRLAFCGN